MFYATQRPLCFAAAVLLSGAGAVAATDILMEGVDTARTGWVRDEKVYTLANVASTKLDLASSTEQYTSLDAQSLSAAGRTERPDAAGSA